MIAVSRSLIASEASIATVEAALSTQFGQNLPLPRWSPSPLPAASEAAPNEAAARPVVDRLMMGMASAGHSVASWPRRDPKSSMLPAGWPRATSARAICNDGTT